MSAIYRTNYTPGEHLVTERAAARFAELVVKTTADALELFTKKGVQQDIRTPFWHRMPHGDASWSTECSVKADRAVAAILRNDAAYLKESLDDLIVYAIAWSAWRKLMEDNNADCTDCTNKLP